MICTDYFSHTPTCSFGFACPLGKAGNPDDASIRSDLLSLDIGLVVWRKIVALLSFFKTIQI